METDKPTSGGNPDSSGSDNDTNGTPAYQKLFKEKKNWVERAKTLETKVTELTEKLESRDNKDLEKQMEYKSLYEKLKTDNDTLKTQLMLKDKQQIESRKVQAVEKKLFEMGLNPKHKDTAMKLVRTDDINIDPDTGVPLGVDDAVKDFYADFKEVLFVKPGMKGNHAAPSMHNGANGKPDFSKMETKDIMQHLHKNYTIKRKQQ